MTWKCIASLDRSSISQEVEISFTYSICSSWMFQKYFRVLYQSTNENLYYLPSVLSYSNYVLQFVLFGTNHIYKKEVPHLSFGHDMFELALLNFVRFWLSILVYIYIPVHKSGSICSWLLNFPLFNLKVNTDQINT